MAVAAITEPLARRSFREVFKSVAPRPVVVRFRTGKASLRDVDIRCARPVPAPSLRRSDTLAERGYSKLTLRTSGTIARHVVVLGHGVNAQLRHFGESMLRCSVEGGVLDAAAPRG